MPRTRLLLLIAIASPVAADEPAPAPVTPAMVSGWVDELGNDDFFVREAATRKLWEVGPRTTRKALVAARDGADEEVAFRARKILWNFDHGILVGTPPEIVRLVEEFRKGNDSKRRAVGKSLAQQGHLQTLNALLQHTLDEAGRARLVPQLVTEVSGSFPRLFAEERHAEVRDWLDLAASAGNTTAHRQRDAFLFLRGELDDRINVTSESIGADSTSKEHAELARLLLISDQLDAAEEHVTKSKDLKLQRELAMRRSDWKSLAADALPGDSGLERQTFRAVFLRLAGDEAELAKVVEQLAETPSWPHGEALLLAERYDEALDVFRKTDNPLTALELGAARGEHADAFDAFGVGADGSGAVEWLHRATVGVTPEKVRPAISRGLGVLREIARLRGREAGRELLEKIRGLTWKHFDPSQSTRLVEVEWQLGYRDEALEDATETLAALEPDKSPPVLAPLFDDREQTAFVCWQWRRRHVATEKLDETPAVSLSWVADLLEGREVDLEIETIVRELVDVAETQPDASARRRWRKTASEMAYDRKRYDLASTAFEPVLQESQLVIDVLWGADILAKSGDWKGAAERYGSVADRNTIATMLQGIALEKGGEVERGRELVDRAHLSLLSDVAARSAAASELSDRGFDDEARRQWETIVRLGPQGQFEGAEAWSVQLASARLGNAISETDPLRAADLWERYLINFANTNAAYTEVRRYLAVSHLVHRTRARGLIGADRIAEALAAAKRAHDVWPGNIEVALQLVPPLDERGRKADADALFDLVHEVAAKRAADFPENAGGHNDLAWLNAKCGRRLDEALVHSRKAVEMEPKSAAYLDTLAEVHFQRGERAQAIEFAEKCIKLDPQSEHYTAQLARFRAE